jgi:Tfp pilus assembly protein FimT
MDTSIARAKQRGQGMTEYIIVVALIAVAAIAVYGYFGKTVRNQTAGLAQEIAGATNSGRGAANTAAGAAATDADTGRGMDNYINQNTRR